MEPCGENPVWRSNGEGLFRGSAHGEGEKRPLMFIGPDLPTEQLAMELCGEDSADRPEDESDLVISDIVNGEREVADSVLCGEGTGESSVFIGPELDTEPLGEQAAMERCRETLSDRPAGEVALRGRVLGEMEMESSMFIGPELDAESLGEQTSMEPGVVALGGLVHGEGETEASVFIGPELTPERPGRQPTLELCREDSDGRSDGEVLGDLVNGVGDVESSVSCGVNIGGGLMYTEPESRPMDTGGMSGKVTADPGTDARVASDRYMCGAGETKGHAHCAGETKSGRARSDGETKDGRACSDEETEDVHLRGAGEAEDGPVRIKREPIDETAYGAGEAAECSGSASRAPGLTTPNDKNTVVPTPVSNRGHTNGIQPVRIDLKIPGGICVEGNIVYVSKQYLYSLAIENNACTGNRFLKVFCDHLSCNGMRATLDWRTECYIRGVIQQLFFRLRRQALKKHCQFSLSLDKKYCRFSCAWVEDERLDGIPPSYPMQAVADAVSYGSVSEGGRCAGAASAPASGAGAVPRKAGRERAASVRRSQRARQPRQLWEPPPPVRRRSRTRQLVDSVSPTATQSPPACRPTTTPYTEIRAIKRFPGRLQSCPGGWREVGCSGPAAHAVSPTATAEREDQGAGATPGPAATSGTPQLGHAAPRLSEGPCLNIKTEPSDDDVTVENPSSADESFYRSVKVERESPEPETQTKSAEPASCSLCSFRAPAGRAALILHMKCRHPDAIRSGAYEIPESDPGPIDLTLVLSCDVCGRTFGDESLLIMHSWSHLSALSKPASTPRKRKGPTSEQLENRDRRKRKKKRADSYRLRDRCSR